MKPYRIKRLAVVLLSGKRLSLETDSKGWNTRPTKLMKEDILDKFANMPDPAVKVDWVLEWL